MSTGGRRGAEKPPGPRHPVAARRQSLDALVSLMWGLRCAGDSGLLAFILSGLGGFLRHGLGRAGDACRCVGARLAIRKRFLPVGVELTAGRGIKFNRVLFTIHE